MSYIKELANVPDVDFLDGMSLETVTNELLTGYAEYYEQATGIAPDLKPANRDRIILQSAALLLYQIIELIDREGKSNLLKYATGSALDNIAAIKRLLREPAQPAKTTLKFSLAEARSDDVTVPAGTRACTESEIVFFTTEAVIIEAGNTEVEAPAEAEVAGLSGNGYPAGTVTELMDLVPYIDSVANTVITSGGKDVQSDEDFTLDIYNAPRGTSMGGPEDAYEALAYKFDPSVSDVKPVSPEPCYVDVYFLMDGELPTSGKITAMGEYFSPKDMRPLGDRVSGKAPVEVTYDITFTYYISADDASAEADIKERVASAVESYKIWQRKIGRDVNPSELIRLVMAAGAKRVELTAPTYAKVTSDAVNGVKVAALGSETVTYGGLE